MAESGGLAGFSRELADAVERAGRSTVALHARRRIPTSGVVWREGVVVSTHHTVERDEGIRVALPDGGRAEAELVGRDPSTDLVVLRLSGGGSPAAERGDAAALRTGNLVLAVGRPWEHGPTASLGVVAAAGGEWRTRRGGRIDRMLRLDLRIHDGFSGGPLADPAGRVLGVNTSGLARGAALTVPVATVDRVVDELLRDGRIRRGYLGIGMQPVRLPAPLRESLPWPAATGLLLVLVEPGSPAAEAGLVLGDVLVGIEDAPVRDLEEVAAWLAGERIGQPLRVHFLRGGAVQEASLTVRERPGREAGS